MGLVVMVVMAQIPPRVHEGWAPYLYIILPFCWSPLMPSAYPKARSAGSIWESPAFSLLGNSQNRRAADGRPLH